MIMARKNLTIVKIRPWRKSDGTYNKILVLINNGSYNYLDSFYVNRLPKYIQVEYDKVKADL